VGLGGQGASDLPEMRSENIVALCDVDAAYAAKTFNQYPNARRYVDFREMLEKESGIDAVVVGTPDHMHAVVSVAAMRHGKHVYCEKPLTHTVQEARLMAETAKKMNVVTQMGNQGHSKEGARLLNEWIWDGAIGPVTEVHVWTNRPIWPQGLARPTETPPVPTSLHWDEWLGPAPERPYHPCYHPFKWRGWWDFGTGALGDMACHTLNMSFAALTLRDPISVVAETSGHNRETYPAWSIITFEYAALGKRDAVTLKWYDGGKRPPEELIAGSKLKEKQKGMAGSGAIMVGEKGTLYAPGDYADKAELIGKDELPDVDFERSPGHFQEWIRAIKGGKPAMSNFPDYAGPLVETMLLGNLAVFAAPEAGTVGKKIEWDAKNLVAKNAPEVMHIVKKEYRKGWALEG